MAQAEVQVQVEEAALGILGVLAARRGEGSQREEYKEKCGKLETLDQTRRTS